MKPLPKLSEVEWSVLYAVYDRQTRAADRHELSRMLSFGLTGQSRSAKLVLQPEFAKLISDDDGQGKPNRDGFYYITVAGCEAVEARRRLLDPETLADRIGAIQQSLKALLDSGLTKRAVMVLVKDRCSRVSMGDIEAVLDALGTIEDAYVKRPGKAGTKA